MFVGLKVWNYLYAVSPASLWICYQFYLLLFYPAALNKPGTAHDWVLTLGYCQMDTLVLKL